jgi:hypothetical protein
MLGVVNRAGHIDVMIGSSSADVKTAAFIFVNDIE